MYMYTLDVHVHLLLHYTTTFYNETNKQPLLNKFVVAASSNVEVSA